MPELQIKRWYDQKVIYSGEAESMLELVLRAYKEKVDLSGAVLRGAVLRGADLSGAVLRGAVLRGAVLSGADLSGAVLSGADLSGAVLRGADLIGADLRGAVLRDVDLRGADLSGADLRGAVLRDAVLSGAEINWTSHDLVSEILRREAGDSIPRQMFAGFIVLRRDLCWDSFLSIHDDAFAAHKEWALTSLRKWVREGDNAPTVLRNTPLTESA